MAEHDPYAQDALGQASEIIDEAYVTHHAEVQADYIIKQTVTRSFLEYLQEPEGVVADALDVVRKTNPQAKQREQLIILSLDTSPTLYAEEMRAQLNLLATLSALEVQNRATYVYGSGTFNDTTPHRQAPPAERDGQISSPSRDVPKTDDPRPQLPKRRG
jgi:hypothetical protein